MPDAVNSCSLEALRAVCRRHGLPAPEALPVPWVGATSRVYPVGTAVVKVPHANAGAVAALQRDTAVAPLARAVGVATPRIIAVGEAGDPLPGPYAVIERVDGVPLARPSSAADVDAAAWRSLGRELAIVHTRIEAEPLRPLLRTFAQSPEVDPRPWTAELARAGRLDAADAGWLLELLERLAPAALAPLPPAFCHGDVNAANVIVGGAPPRLTLIDWAGAGWLDPVWDFAGVPLAAVPAMLAGHRAVSPLAGDATAPSRVLWCHLQVALDRLLRHPPPDPAAEVSRLLAAARAYLGATGITGPV